MAWQPLWLLHVGTLTAPQTPRQQRMVLSRIGPRMHQWGPGLKEANWDVHAGIHTKTN